MLLGVPHLGTPCTAQATRVMLLGSSEPGKEVLIALQRLAAETQGLPTSPCEFCDSPAELQAAIEEADEGGLKSV